jgi:Skp family chaperone for outer membrane proteins
LQADLQAIVEKSNSGQQLSAEEQTRFQTLRSTLSSVQQRYAAEIAEAVKPALAAVDQVIREVAAENDYTLVLDRTVAGPTGINLVVYAKEGLDITPQIIERIRAFQ